MSEPKILIKIVDSSKKVKRVSSAKKRKLYRIAKAVSFKDCVINVRASYETVGGNEGTYKTRWELLNALEAFWEADT